MKCQKKSLTVSSMIIAFCLISLFCGGIHNSAYANEPIKWKFLTSWPAHYSGNTYQFYPWIKAINEKLKGKLEVSFAGPESVPGSKQLKPVREGVFDGLFTHPAYHAGDIALGMGMDLFRASPTEREKGGLFKILDEAYRTKQNIHYLTFMGDGLGYQIRLRDKCITTANLDGLKIRTNPMYEPLIRKMGGATVAIPSSEEYSAMEKGIVDGLCGTAFDIISYKSYEVAKYQLRPRFGETGICLLVNLDSWNKLPKNLQEEVTQISIEAAETGRQRMKEEYKDIEAESVRLGCNTCDLPPKEGEKLLNYFYEETWKFVNKLSPQYGPKLKEAADKMAKK